MKRPAWFRGLILLSVAVPLFGVDMIRAAKPPPPIDPASLKLRITEVSRPEKIVDGRTTLSAKTGYQLVVVTLKGNKPRPGSLVFHAREFSALYAYKIGAGKVHYSMTSAAAVHLGSWVIPHQGQMITLTSRKPSGPLTIKVAFVLRKWVKSFWLRLPSRAPGKAVIKTASAPQTSREAQTGPAPPPTVSIKIPLSQVVIKLPPPQVYKIKKFKVHKIKPIVIHKIKPIVVHKIKPVVIHRIKPVVSHPVSRPPSAKKVPPPGVTDDFARGLAAYQGHDYVAAMRIFSKLAERGHLRAQYQLGQMYEKGRGAPKNYGLAVKWYRQAAAKGLPDAQWRLGHCYWFGRGVSSNLATAVKYFRLAAKQGHAGGQNDLGAMYKWGLGVKKDKAKAERWFRLAAEQGLAAAQFNLAEMLNKGLNDRPSLVRAAKWYRLAAEQGQTLAQFKIGLLTLIGIGGKPDMVQAYVWFKLAGRQGHAKGKDYSARLAKRLTPSQLAAANKRVAAWKPKKRSPPPTTKPK